MRKFTVVARPRRQALTRPRDLYLEEFSAGGGKLMHRPKDDVAL